MTTAGEKIRRRNATANTKQHVREGAAWTRLNRRRPSTHEAHSSETVTKPISTTVSRDLHPPHPLGMLCSINLTLPSLPNTSHLSVGSIRRAPPSRLYRHLHSTRRRLYRYCTPLPPPQRNYAHNHCRRRKKRLPRRSANWASLVMASASSRMTSFTPELNRRFVPANSLIWPRTTSIPRSSEAFNCLRTKQAVLRRNERRHEKTRCAA